MSYTGFPGIQKTYSMVGLLAEKRQYCMWGVEAEHGDTVIPSMFEEKGPTGSRSWFMLVVVSPMCVLKHSGKLDC